VPRIFFVVALLFLLGMLASLAALRRDFVKRQQVQQRLLAEVALRSAMERSVAIGMRAWDFKGRILYVNQAFCAMVGYSAQELRGTSAPLPYWPAHQSDELALLHAHVIHQGTEAQGIEVQFQHRDGHGVDVLIHEAPLLAADGTQLGWMSSVLDISERKRAQQLAALQQERLDASGRLVAVGEVASTLAHELNQPLGALASFANGLLNRLRAGSITPAEVQPVVQRMAQLAERAGGVIQRVNAFARRRELTLSRVDLAALVRRAVAAAQEARSVPVTLDLPTQPVWVQGDALLLEHLVHNLCGNALDWAGLGPREPRVRVRLDTPAGAENQVRLSVADSGPGVPEHAQARIFDAFFSTKDGGMGMGLAICRSIAEAHHGRIGVGQDAGLGGAHSPSSCPWHRHPPPPTRETRHDRAAASRGHPHRGRRRRRARRPGLAVRLARLPAARLGQRHGTAGGRARPSGPLGRGRGAAGHAHGAAVGALTFERLKALGCPWPVLFLTGHGDVGSAVEAVKNGAWDFLEKPFQDNVLVDRVEQAMQAVLARTDAQRELQRLRQALASLSPREREVLDELIRGHYNKNIAEHLGITARTVEFHRANIFEKMGVESAVELAHQIGRLASVDGGQPS
jgi:PAS domain S-box-containing protein